MQDNYVRMTFKPRGVFLSSCFLYILLLLLFRLQFRNQYDNDVTVWSPQVKYHLLFFPLPASDLLMSLAGLVVISSLNYFLFVLIQGRIHQIEYAMEAVKQGSATVGLKSRTHAVLVALKVRSLNVERKLLILDSGKPKMPLKKFCIIL